VNVYGDFSPVILGVQIGCTAVVILAVVRLTMIAIKSRKEK